MQSNPAKQGIQFDVAIGTTSYKYPEMTEMGAVNNTFPVYKFSYTLEITYLLILFDLILIWLLTNIIWSIAMILARMKSFWRN